MSTPAPPGPAADQVTFPERPPRLRLRLPKPLRAAIAEELQDVDVRRIEAQLVDILWITSIDLRGSSDPGARIRPGVSKLTLEEQHRVRTIVSGWRQFRTAIGEDLQVALSLIGGYAYFLPSVVRDQKPLIRECYVWLSEQLRLTKPEWEEQDLFRWLREWLWLGDALVLEAEERDWSAGSFKRGERIAGERDRVLRRFIDSVLDLLVEVGEPVTAQPRGSTAAVVTVLLKSLGEPVPKNFKKVMVYSRKEQRKRIKATRDRRAALKDLRRRKAIELMEYHARRNGQRKLVAADRKTSDALRLADAAYIADVGEWSRRWEENFLKS